MIKPEGKGTITRILPRKNDILRPAVANVDQAMVIFAAAEPAPNLKPSGSFSNNDAETKG